MREFSANLVSNNKKYAIVVARFNNFITDRLLEGCLDALKRHEVKDEEISMPFTWRARIGNSARIASASKAMLKPSAGRRPRTARCRGPARTRYGRPPRRWRPRSAGRGPRIRAGRAGACRTAPARPAIRGPRYSEAFIARWPRPYQPVRDVLGHLMAPRWGTFRHPKRSAQDSRSWP